MKALAIIQARTGSTRLPGKVLLPLAGVPMFVRVAQRTQLARAIDQVVVATTTEKGDDAIADLCRQWQIGCYRGSLLDVLDRYYQAARANHAAVVARITSDCPCIEPEIIDQVAGEFARHQPLDYAGNVLEPRTFPRGLDVEVFTFALLERLWSLDTDPARREHVTEYVFQRPHEFRTRAIRNDVDYSHLRWTVDTPEDYELARRIYEHFGDHRFHWRAVLELLARHPDWVALNRGVKQKII